MVVVEVFVLLLVVVLVVGMTCNVGLWIGGIRRPNRRYPSRSLLHCEAILRMHALMRAACENKTGTNDGTWCAHRPDLAPQLPFSRQERSKLTLTKQNNNKKDNWKKKKRL